MIPLLNCQDLSIAFGSKPLFSNINFTINAGEKLGLIGPNGSGKSSLLKALAGNINPEKGEIVAKNEIRIVYLAQDDQLDLSKSIHSIMESACECLDLDETDKYSRIKRWLARAEFKESDQTAEQLSGGWRKRLSIISCLIQEPDLLLMDEPTNHLDLEGICWLEELLKSPDFAFILVTHDRYFLENVTNKMIELNRQFPKGFIQVDGAYSDFLLQREAVLDNQMQLETVLANKLRRETEWLNRGPKARTSKARFRIEEAYKLREEHSEVRKRNVDKLVVGFDFDGTKRRSKKLLEAKKISKSFGDAQLFDNLDITLSPNSCIGLLGRNGTGKSTLVSILANELDADSGEVRWADDLKIVLFDQNREQLDQSLTLKEALSPTGDSVVFRGRSIHVISWAKRFLFDTEKLELPISQLSGGEQARILIANLMLKPADILLLDEPTNDLDITSLEVLESSIKEFPGAVILVTHDRFLLDRLVNAVIGFNGKGQALHYADYTQWLDDLKKNVQQRKKEKQKSEKPKVQIRKLTYKEQIELNGIEEKIAEAESELETYQSQTQDPAIISDSKKLEESCTLMQQAQDEVDFLYARWEELEAIKEGT